MWKYLSGKECFRLEYSQACLAYSQINSHHVHTIDKYLRIFYASSQPKNEKFFVLMENVDDSVELAHNAKPEISSRRRKASRNDMHISGGRYAINVLFFESI